MQLVVVVICGAAFLAQVILPEVVKEVMMPLGLIGGVEVEAQQINNSAAWNGRAWYARNTASVYEGNQTQLVSVPLDQAGPPRIEGIVSMIEPWLLAGEDRLWVVSRNELATWHDGQIETVATEMGLTEVSRPFIYDGQPAVLDLHASGYTLLVWRGRQWVRQGEYELAVDAEPLAATGSDLQVVTDEGQLHVFCRPTGEAIRYRRGLEGDDWETVVDLGFLQQWKAVVVGGEPYVFYHDDRRSGGPYITGLRREDGRWQPYLHHRIGADIGLGALPGAGNTDIVLLRRVVPLGVEAIGLQGDQVAWTSSEEGDVGLSGRYRFWSMVPRVVPPLVSALLVVVLTVVLARLKPSFYEHGGRRVRFASPLRRGIAAGVDGVLVLAPLVTWGYGRVDGLLQNFTLGGLFGTLGAMLCVSTFWLVLAFLAVSLMEGLWGRTPGKWLTGIRVARTDLSKPGFGWAALRNLVRPVDMIQWYLLGMLLVGLSDRWQRVGDLAAGTIVVRAKDQPPSA
jgi:uncharacterized RDD family membrane protein YckC